MEKLPTDIVTKQLQALSRQNPACELIFSISFRLSVLSTLGYISSCSWHLAILLTAEDPTGWIYPTCRLLTQPDIFCLQKANTLYSERLLKENDFLSIQSSRISNQLWWASFSDMALLLRLQKPSTHHPSHLRLRLRCPIRCRLHLCRCFNKLSQNFLLLVLR